MSASRRSLELLLGLTSLLLSGCCEVLSLGWRRSVPARPVRTVVPAAGLTSAATTVPADVCQRVCGEHPDLRCTPTQEPLSPPLRDARVRCRGTSVREAGRPVELVTPAFSEGLRRFFDDGWAGPDRCASVCTSPEMRLMACRVESWGSSDVPSGRVACEWIEPSHCGGASLSQGRAALSCL